MCEQAKASPEMVKFVEDLQYLRDAVPGADTEIPVLMGLFLERVATRNAEGHALLGPRNSE